MFILNGLSKSGSKYMHKFPGAEAQISRTPQASEPLPQGNARCAWMLQELKARVQENTSHLQKEIKQNKNPSQHMMWNVASSWDNS